MFDSSFQHLVIQMHLFCTLFMTGLIWFVQVVHYPFLRFAKESEPFVQFYRQRTGWIVLPVMLVELATAILLMASSWVTLYGNYLLANLVLLLLIWGVTFVRISPMHRRLADQVDQGIINSLVTSNWIRTILWSLRSLILIQFLG